MLDRIILFALRNRLFVVSVALLLLVYGVTVILRLPVDVFPDLNRPTVTVMSEAPGLAPEEVETLVSLPIETTLNGAPGVERVRSTSGIGLSVVTVEFAWGTDIYRDRQLVGEKLQLASEHLPKGVAPAMGPVSSIMGEIMLLGLESTTGQTSPMEMRTLADWVVRQRLLTIPGVSQVIPIGGGVKQYQVRVNPQRLAALGLSLKEVEQAVGASNVNTTGGYLEAQSQEYLIRNLGRLRNPEQLLTTVVAMRNGVPVLLKEVGSVSIGTLVKRGDGSVNGKPAVILSIQKQPGASTIDLTRRIETALTELRPSLPADVRMRPLFKQANFIETAIRNVEQALRDGAILVLIVLFLFLLNFRTTAITLTAIPLSFVTAAVVFHLFNISINTMTLGGLAIAIGELVDDAIVNVENVFRRLRENRHAAQPRPALEVVYRASSEVRNSIVYATILVVLVFLPLFALSGIEGRLFAPLGVAYIVSILASFVVSLTVSPALCLYLLPGARVMAEEKDSFVVRHLKQWDRRLLDFTLPHPGVVIGGAILLVLAAGALVPLMGREFLPPFNEGTATINVIAAPGTSLSESNRIGTIAEQQLLRVPEAISTGRRTGRAELDEHAEGVHYTEIDVDFRRSKRSRDEVLGDIRSRLGEIPGVFVNIGQPISHRLDHLLSGVRAQIAVKLFGNDLDLLRAKAAEIQTEMGTVPGVVDLQVEKQVLVPQIRIEGDRVALARYGLNVGDLNETLETALNGRVVSQVLEGQRTFDLLVRFDDASRGSLEAIRNALIDTPSGAKVPLSAIAAVEDSRGPNVIQHENVQRRIVVSANVSGRDLGRVVEDIQKKVGAQVTLPTGYFITYGGQFESQQSATRLIGILSLFSLAAMFLVLYAHFRSIPIVLQILLNIPLALIGSVVAIFLTGGTFSVASLVGFITLTGIASRNTIMMVSHYLHLMKEEGESFDMHMVVRGSLERLVPVLMTALTAGLALIPLVLARGEPGKEILYPVATVILGGLISSTLLDTIVTPAVFYRFGRKSAEKYLAGVSEES
jgi:CzcA family heavy metal efflux pump